MHILFITEVSPFPTNGGERMRCTGLLKAVSDLGYNVTAIIANEDMVHLENYSIKNVLFVDYDYQKRNTNNLTKSLNYFRKDKHLLSLIEQILKKHPVDIVFIDYFFLGQYISFFKKINIPVIYGTHNAQANLTKQQVSISLLSFFRTQALGVIHSLHERVYFNKADGLIVVSEEDKVYYANFVNSQKINIIPNFLDMSDYNVSSKKENYIVMTGNFQSFQNANGIRWFLTHVWNKELSGKTRLVLAGKGSHELIDELRRCIHCENVEATGVVDDIKLILSGAKVAIVPLLHGSGSRLKCLEAMALKTQLVSTSLGAQGIMSEESIIINDDAESFRQSILDILLDNLDETKKAYDIVNVNYSLNFILPLLDVILKELLDQRTLVGK